MVREGAVDVGCLSQMTHKLQDDQHYSGGATKSSSSCMKQSLYYSWDLEVDASFRPIAVDGEVAQFRLWTASELEQEVRYGNNLRPAMRLVITDFLMRHGIITPDTESNYTQIRNAMTNHRLVCNGMMCAMG
uniref:Uncharacterized protein n=1 Tax=Attheya septentrionalis TaxID=420275 RepID=A0A7S2XRZ1_9STRA